MNFSEVIFVFLEINPSCQRKSGSTDKCCDKENTVVYKSCCKSARWKWGRQALHLCQLLASVQFTKAEIVEKKEEKQMAEGNRAFACD